MKSIFGVSVPLVLLLTIFMFAGKISPTYASNEQSIYIGQFSAADYMDHTPQIPRRKTAEGITYVGMFWADAEIDKDGEIVGFTLDKGYLANAAKADPELPKVLTKALFTIKFRATGEFYTIRVLLPVGIDITADDIKQRGIELKKVKGLEK
jgi:hypothetical protein